MLSLTPTIAAVAQALDTFAKRQTVPSAWLTADWAQAPAEIVQRSFFSAGVESARFLQEARAGCVLPDPKGLRAKAAEAAETLLRDQVPSGKWAIETPTVAESGSASSVVLGPAHTHKTLEIQRTDQAGV